MIVLVQRVLSATLKIDGEKVSKIERGLLAYVGITDSDTEKTGEYLMNRLANIRIFEDENGKLNRSVSDIEGNILLVSNFTLYGNALSGRRPDFIKAAKYDFAAKMFDFCKEKLTSVFPRAEFGVFGADMKIESVADGPINIIMEV